MLSRYMISQFWYNEYGGQSDNEKRKIIILSNPVGPTFAYVNKLHSKVGSS